MLMYIMKSKKYIFLFIFIFSINKANDTDFLIMKIIKNWYKLFLKTNTFPGIFHNDASGIASSSLIVDADIDPSAAIADSKLTTIATAGKVSNSATTATNTNVDKAIVARDGTGSFAAQNISMVEGLVS